MTQEDLGKTIAMLRKKAGYTQQSLANALFITDKAVSKWERGICSPDSSILPKLAGLLDTDLASLLPDAVPNNEWKGLLILEEGETDAGTIINGKPLLHYLLSYFLLLKIKDIEIRNCDPKVIESFDLSKYGFNISFTPQSSEKKMIVFGKTLLFGAYLSMQLQNMMATGETVMPTLDGKPLPILFLQNETGSADSIPEKAKQRSLYRGTLNLPLNTREQVQDAETFIHIYEKNHDVCYCDLQEIARRRGLIG